MLPIVGVRRGRHSVTVKNPWTRCRQEWRPGTLVVGLLMHADGTEHEVSRLARRFAQRLEGRFAIRPILVDERLTSKTAAARLREAGVKAGDVQAQLDAAAAAEILQAWFEQRGP